MPVSAIYGDVDHTIILGLGYTEVFKVGSSALVRPTNANPNITYTGIASFVQNAILANYGFVYGSNGVTEAGRGSAGGVGVYLARAGDTLLNFATISGGEGGTSLASNGYGNYGGAGGTGVNLISTGATSTNSGTIFGGQGGNGSLGYGAGAGGVGLDLSGGTLDTTGIIEGGQGGYSNGALVGAAGGDGVDVGAGGVLNNLSGNSETSIRGGDGGAAYGGGQGGVGVSLAAGATLQNDSRIVGGDGAHSIYTGQDPRALGGDGGVGLQVSTGATVTLDSGSVISGGTGGNGYLGGNGGIGMTLASGVTLSNAGTITGGAATGYGARSINDVVDFGGSGGAGVSITNGLLVNTGSIAGGAGTYEGPFGDYGAAAGVGVYLNGGTLINAGAIRGGYGYGGFAYDVEFGPKGGTLVVDSTARFGHQTAGSGQYAYALVGNIGGFAPGDTIDITNMTPDQVDANLSAVQSTPLGQLYVSLSLGTVSPGFEGILNIDLSAGDSSETFSVTSAGSGADITLVPCYRRGTRIDTDAGEVPIEALRIGDRVATLGGPCLPIRWIGRRTYAPSFAAANLDVLPVLIRAGALGDGLPRRDLWVSPEHAMYIDGMLIAARDLINGESIVQDDCVDELVYFHLEFDTHAVLYAEGAPAESFVDDESREMFDNAWEYHRLYPHALRSAVHFCAPRLEEGYLLQAVRRRFCGGDFVNRP